MILNTHPNDRKEMVKAISELTGLEATYLYMPTCAYQIGPVTVNRNGSVTCDDEAMVETIRPMLIERGWLDAEPKTEETLADSEAPVSVREMKLTMPIEGWTVSQMANLLRMVYGKQRLINRMLDSEMLYVGEAIITTISENPPGTPEDFEAKVQTAIETGRLKGMDISAEKVTLLMVRRRWRDALRCGEVRFLGALLAIFVPLTAISLATGLYLTAGEALRQALFNIVSALSTTGYATMSYAGWPQAAIGVMILMMLVGGGTGSTAGGIKLSRALILTKCAAGQLRSRLSPEHAVRAPYYFRAQGRTAIDHRLLNATAGFVVTYLTVFVAGTLLLTVTSGATLTEAMFEFASSLGTVGLSIGLTGPATNAATLLVEIAGMLLGRLEIFIVFTGVGSALLLLRRRTR